MYSTVDNRKTPSAHQLYKNIVKKISFTQPSHKNQLKQQIDNKYKKHLQLLESHRKRQDRFFHNFTNLQKKFQQTKKQKQEMFLSRQQKSSKKKDLYLTQKKKKIGDSLSNWNRTVNQNQEKYLKRLDKSTDSIKRWNQKCQESMEKKRQRLNTVSSNISQRSRVLSAKASHYQQKQYQKMLQRALVNPQKSKQSSRMKYSNTKLQKQRSNFSKLSGSDHSRSRVSTSSRVSTQQSHLRFEKIQKQKLDLFLQKLLKKQNKIVDARTKKDDLIKKIKKQRSQKQMYIGQLHKQNNHYLTNKRQATNQKLDKKFFQDRIKRKQANKSLPAISNRPNLQTKRQQYQVFNNHLNNNLNKKNQKSFVMNNNKQKKRVIPKYDKLIMDQIRNISLVTKMRQYMKN